ncbi:MAG: Bax inhibitor-1/YccA family protein [Nannocystaceae bacterium]
MARFMTGVFGWMSAGLAVTAIVAFLASQSDAYLHSIYYFGRTIHGTLVPVEMTGLGWVIMLAPLAFVWFMGSRLQRMDAPVAAASFLAFSALMGASLGHLPMMYNMGSLSGVFVVTAGMFGSIATFGYLTKRDLSGLGRFLMMALFGLVLAIIVSYFVPGMSLFIAVIGVLLFAGLTAYDTQNIKQVYLVQGGRGNLSILGALKLYLDFINMFLFLLRLFGNRN